MQLILMLTYKLIRLLNLKQRIKMSFTKLKTIQNDGVITE